MSPHMDYLGLAKRFTPYKNKNFADPVVKGWMDEDKIEMETRYLMCNPNTAAMTKSISKYNRAQPGKLNRAAWQIAGDWTLKHFMRFMGMSRVETFEKVTVGLDRTTSAGYPWSLKFKNKGDFIDSEIFKPVMQNYWDKLATTNPDGTLWTASLKRELRPIEKLETNSIRTFTASATEHSAACNRLCLDMNEKFYASNNKTWSFVGRSKYNRGFDDLIKRLGKHPNAFELDESSFDASLFREAMEGQRDLRWELLHPDDKTPENKRRLWNIYSAIVDSVIVLDNGEVVQKHTGNPSGSANTIVDNTMILFRLFAYAWIMAAIRHEKKTSKGGFATYTSFQSEVEAALNGDDNTFTCSDAVVGWFNPQTISEIWTEIGVTTTTPCMTARKLEDVSFLSHSFKQVSYKGEKAWLPVPEREKVLASLLLASKFADPRWTLLRCSALRMESWPDEKLRAELARLHIHIWKNYQVELNGEIHGLTMNDIAGIWKTDDEMWRLYARRAVKGKVNVTRREMKVLEAADTLISESKQLMLRKCVMCRCETVSYQPEEMYRCIDCKEKMAIKVSENKDQVIRPVPVNYQSPPPNKWRGKGKGSKGFNFDFKSQCLCGETEMYMPHKKNAKQMAPAKGKAKGKGKGKSQNKPRQKGQKKKPKGKPRNGPTGAGGTRQSFAAPVAMGSVGRNNQSRTTPVRHRESLGPVVSTGTGFQVNQFLAINPALPASFPWLSPIAAQYETYAPKRRMGKRGKCHAIRYIYETRCATSTAGTVVLVTNYDASEGQFTSLQQAENYRGATVGQPWITFDHQVEVDSMRDYNRHYCRSGAQTSGTDIKTYDVGNFSLILSGCPAGQMGELFVEYDIDFFDPRVANPVGATIPSAHIQAVGGATAAAPLTGATLKSGSTMTPTFTAAGLLTVPSVGRYLVGVGYVAAAISTQPDCNAGTGAAAVNIINNNTSGEVQGFILNGQGAYLGVFDITAPNGQIQMSGGGTYTAGNTDVFIVQLSSGQTLKPPTEDRLDKLEKMLARVDIARFFDSRDEKEYPVGTSKGQGAPRRIVIDQTSDDDAVLVQARGLKPAAAEPTSARAKSAGPR